MPLALLLKNLAGTLATAARTLTPWIEIVALESIVVERARSAFLVHWFGFRLPFAGLNLRAVIVNIDALDRRFLEAQRSVPVSAGAPNLTAPILGFAGMVAGMAISPAGAIAGIRVLWQYAEHSLGTMVKALLWFAVPALLVFGMIAAPVGTTVLVGGGLSAAGLGFGVLAALGDRREVRAVYDVLGALARMFNAALVLLDQLHGPRAEVRNPLLQKVLRLADRMAALFAQALGAIATLIVQIGPALGPAARTVVRLGALAGGVAEVLGITANAVLDNVTALSKGALSVRPVIARVTDVARRQLPIVRTAATAELELIAKTFGTLADRLGTALDVFATAVVAFLKDYFSGNAMGIMVTALLKEIDLISAAFKLPAAPSTGPPKPSPMAPLLAELPDLPDVKFPSLPPMPDTDRIRKELGAASVPPLTVESIRTLADVVGPSTAATAPITLGTEATAALKTVAGQRGLIPSGRPFATALTLNKKQLEHFRESFSVVVGRVLPPELRGTGTEQLATVFAAVDHHLYGAKERKIDADRLPVLDLPEDDRVQPVVPRLVLRTRGTTLGEARQFQAQLTERLQRQSYRVGAAGSTGGVR